jgi:hypothetical protein
MSLIAEAIASLLPSSSSYISISDGATAAREQVVGIAPLSANLSI